MTPHAWESLEDMAFAKNLLGFRWYCYRCGSVSGERKRPSPYGFVPVEGSTFEPSRSNCDAAIVREVMSS